MEIGSQCQALCQIATLILHELCTIKIKAGWVLIINKYDPLNPLWGQAMTYSRERKALTVARMNKSAMLRQSSFIDLLVTHLLYLQAPAPSVGAANRSNRVVFGGVAANPILIRAAVPVPAPGPALSPSIAQALPVITSRTGKDGIPEELAPAPGLQTTYVFSATADKQDNATAPTEDDSLTGLPAMADIGTPEVQPQILVTPTNVSINQIAPSPSPGPAPVQLPQQSLVFASDTDPSPAPEPAPAPAPSQVLICSTTLVRQQAS